MRRRLFFTCGLLCALLLAGCSSDDTLIYDVTLDAPDETQALALLLDLEEVVERRASARPEIGDIAVTTTPRRGNRGLMMIDGADTAEKRASITSMLDESFTFEIKREVAAAPAAGTGAQERMWETTGITGKNLTWVRPIKQASSGAVGAELTFDEQGRKLFGMLFTQHPGATIGIFVRDFLVSELKIESANDVRDRIIITGIPDERVAEVFADDVNVGLHTSLSLR